MPGPIKPPNNAILLGTDTWIEHVDLTGRYELAVNVDLLLKELEPMWSALETECVAGCCGLDAFDFSPESIASASAKLDVAEICAKIGRLRSELAGIGAEVFVSQRLNNYADRVVFEALLAHLQTKFSEQSGGDA